MNTISLNTLLLVFAVVFLTNGITAQNNQIRNYTLADGLPQSQVYDIVQDEIGYLWVGSQGGGLSSFDGIQFKVWNEKDGLLSNYIQTLQFIDNRLFIGTREGLSIKDKSTFENFKTPQINSILETYNGTILGTNKGVFVYTKSNGVTSVKVSGISSQTIINDLLFDGTWYWVATNKGLWRFNSILQETSETLKVAEGNFKSLLWHNKKLYAASFYKGVYVYKDALVPEIFSVARRINNLSLIDGNELWIATDISGIKVVHPDQMNVLRTINTSNGLSVNHIRTCFKDKQDNIWIASSGGGLYRYFQNNFRHYNTNNGLKGNRVYAVTHFNNAIWASNSEKGLVKIDSLGVHSIANDSITYDVKIKTLTHDNLGNIIAGSDGKGLFVINETIKDSIVTDSVINFQDIKTIQVKKTNIKHVTIADGLPSDWIKKVVFHNNALWVATYSNGIVKLAYGKAGYAVTKIFQYKDGLTDALINDMSVGPNGKLWFVTKSGTIGYIINDKIKNLEQQLPVSVGIGTILFNNNTLFVGTPGKGIWWSPLNKLKFKKLTGSKTLYSENVYQLLFDAEAHLWVGSERGVDKVTLNDSLEIVDVKHYGRNEGFLGIETCLNAVTKDANDRLWFGGIYGLTSYQNSAVKEKQLKPVVFFENIEVAYKAIDSIAINSWAKNHTLQLQEDQNHLAFTFRTVDLKHPEAIYYRYQLNNDTWSPWTSENKVTFANLDFGDYTFTVQSRNSVWDKSDPKSFQFHIKTPLHKQPWFKQSIYIALGVLGILIIWLFFRRVKQRNKEERARLELENHLLSLEHKALQLQMNPHFIFNVLNGIKAMGADNHERMNETINKFARLLRDTLNNSRTQHITLDQEIKTLKSYIDIEQIMTKKSFTYTIQTNVTIDPEEILIPPMLIQPFVENAIKHGIMVNKKDGELTITFSNDDEFLHCEITDNGIGIHQSQQEKTNTSHQSMALTVTRERIASLSGKNTLTIEDIGKLNAAKTGTKVSFSIPLLTEY